LMQTSNFRVVMSEDLQSALNELREVF
jgi:hypothetical protein